MLSPIYVAPTKRPSVEPPASFKPYCSISPRKDDRPMSKEIAKCWQCHKEGYFATECYERRYKIVREISSKEDYKEGFGEVKVVKNSSDSEN